MDAPTLTLKIMSGGFAAPGWTDTFVVYGSSVVIGTGEKADWALDDSDNVVAEEHCRIRLVDGAYTIAEDAPNGTVVNGQAVEEGVPPLSDGDLIGIGPFVIRVRIQLNEGQPEVADKQRTVVSMTDGVPVPELTGLSPAATDWPEQTDMPEFSAKEFVDFMGRRFDEAAPQIEAPRWPPGQALFKVPRQMWLETEERAVLGLSPDDAIVSALKRMSAKTQSGRTGGEDQSDWVLRAVLHADPVEFELSTLGPSEQSMTSTELDPWEWLVRPKLAGHSLLTLTLSIDDRARPEEPMFEAQPLRISVEIYPAPGSTP